MKTETEGDGATNKIWKKKQTVQLLLLILPND